MRLSLSILGVAGVALTVVSLLLPWLVREWSSNPPVEFDTTLTHFSVYFASDPADLTSVAYSASLYLVVVGLSVSIYSLLGGFATLAGALAFSAAGAFGDDRTYSFGTNDSIGLSVVPGVGLFIGLVAAALLIVAIWYPFEVGFGKGGQRPELRTWHLSR